MIGKAIPMSTLVAVPSDINAVQLLPELVQDDVHTSANDREGHGFQA